MNDGVEWMTVYVGKGPCAMSALGGGILSYVILGEILCPGGRYPRFTDGRVRGGRHAGYTPG